jgi:hypothetical protein
VREVQYSNSINFWVSEHLVPLTFVNHLFVYGEYIYIYIYIIFVKFSVLG